MIQTLDRAFPGVAVVDIPMHRASIDSQAHSAPSSLSSNPLNGIRSAFMKSTIGILFGLAFPILLSHSSNAIAADTSLANDFVQATWQLTEKGAATGTFVEKKTNESLRLQGDFFKLLYTDGAIRNSSDFAVVGTPRIETLDANPKASRLAERLGGHQIVVDLASSDDGAKATWKAILRDGSNYLREEVALTAGTKSLPIKELILLDLPVVNARPTGSVDGSPAATKTMFFGLEQPLSINRGEMGYVRCFLPRGSSLNPGETLSASLVMGFVREGQLRREFMTYLERERAHPYRPFLNYNTWYDIGYFSRYDEPALLNAINAFGEELVNKRHVKIDSFLLDDGWDDMETLWRPHHGFPEGFTAVAKTAGKYGAALGFWLSPWGGYGHPKEVRLENGKAQGFEIADGSFSMAGPKYYERFRSLCVDVVKQYDVNQFKFDGIGAGDTSGDNATSGAGGATRDFEAMLRLVAELRALKPDIYINQTTGTWPSPFWLINVDSIWRGGDDHSFAGRGTDRQQWITYRDSDVYTRIVSQSELYPVTSLMLHGMVYAKSANKLNVDPKGDFKSEVRSFFGTGTQMQEMYITPALMTPETWDMLAESARWSRENADVLQDTHWVGGDPSELHVYGWASWSLRKGILTLRNPSSRPAKIEIDVQKIFELPVEAAREYDLTSPYKDQRISSVSLKAGSTYQFTLDPFEVLVFDAAPKTEK